MKPINQPTCLRVTSFSILLLLLTTCNVRAPVIYATQTAGIPPAGISSIEDDRSLPPDDNATLRSLKKIDDYPFYVMQYYGDYDYPRESSSLPKGSDFSCSLFASLGETGDRLYGRNFDWDFSPALLLYTDPPNGYASASMVDLTFLGIDPADVLALSDLPLAKRKALLTAPSMPFDGMNEYGLTIGMAAVPDEYADDASYDPSRPTIGSIGIIRQILDHARNVDEALVIFGQYNIKFGGGPPIHYLLADPSGKSVLIEFYEHDMVVLTNDTSWHLATNHLRCIAKGNGGCGRYQTISDRLTELDGELDQHGAMQLLSDVKQDITQWSAVYDMTNGDIAMAIAGQYESVYSFHLDLVEP